MVQQAKTPESYTTTDIYEVAYCLDQNLKPSTKRLVGTKYAVTFEGPVTRKGKTFTPEQIALEYYNSDFKRMIESYIAARNLLRNDRFNQKTRID